MALPIFFKPFIRLELIFFIKKSLIIGVLVAVLFICYLMYQAFTKRCQVHNATLSACHVRFDGKYNELLLLLNMTEANFREITVYKKAE